MDAKRTGELIQNRRKQLDLSQKQLAERLDISPKTVSKWETGRGLPDTGILLLLSECLGCSVENLLKGEPDAEKIEQNNQQQDVALNHWKKYAKRKKYDRAIMVLILSILFLGSLTGGIIGAFENRSVLGVLCVCICIGSGIIISIQLMSLRIRDWRKQTPVVTEGMILEKKIRISGGGSATGYPCIVVRLYGDEKKTLDIKEWAVYDRIFPGDLIALTYQGFVLTECEVLKPGALAQEAAVFHVTNAQFLKKYVKTVARWHHYSVADFRLENNKKITLRVNEEWDSPTAETAGELHWHGEYMDRWNDFVS
ncbi:helix-turn-helix domain-containing protein [Eubacterium ramulus]